VNIEIDFSVLSAAALILLSLVAGGVAIASSVLYRSTLLKKEAATRRVLGARRSQIARMF
jgi:ABC-type antimicrobial peptide transport system permease subunit